MQFIDRYAYQNAIRRIDPAQKAALALLALSLCLLLDRPVVGGLTIGWMLGLTAGWARVSAWIFIRAVLAEGGFLALSTASVALSVSLVPMVAPWSWHLGPLWLSTNPAALTTMLQSVTRALGSAAALNFLILTTPLVDLIDLLRRLRVPALLIDLMTIIYCTIFVLLESLERMFTAQDARLGYHNGRQAMQSAALLASRLVLETYERSRRMQIALDSRGMDSTLRVLPSTYTRTRHVWWLGAAIAASMLWARISL